MVRYQIISRPNKKVNPFINYLLHLNATGYLIILNVLFFIIFIFLGFMKSLVCADTICRYIALQPNNLFVSGYWWTLLTSMFMHVDPWMHLLFNMISLFFLGGLLEMLIGKKRFLWFYLLSGIFAGLFFAFLAFSFGSNPVLGKIFGTSQTYAVGASGAIFAIAGVIAILAPRLKVNLLLGPLIAFVAYSLLSQFVKSATILNLAYFILLAYIFISFFSIFSFNPKSRNISLSLGIPIWVIPFIIIFPFILVDLFLPSEVSLGMGNMAHLGGFLFGLFYGKYLRLKYKKKTRFIERTFSR